MLFQQTEEDPGAENARRKALREKWFAENKLTLFYNTIHGVTAVMTPDEYAGLERVTHCNRRDNYWKSETVLLPCSSAVVFVNQEGKKFIEANKSKERHIVNIPSWNRNGSKTGSDLLGECFISDLDDIVTQHGVELVRKSTIFVPYVNVTIRSFERQSEMLEHYDLSHRHGPFHSLMERQAPKELWPV